MGRPAAGEQRHLADDILAAAEACLARGDPPRNVSLKEIALMAGTNQAMVAYYFGSKDGLLIAIVDRDIKAITIEIERFQQEMRRGEFTDLTRATVVFVANTFRARPSIGQILNNELIHKDSPIRAYYTEHWASRFCNHIADAIRYAIDTGWYRADLDVNQTVDIFRALVFFPMLIQPYKDLFSSTAHQDAYADSVWLDNVCKLLDSYVRPSVASTQLPLERLAHTSGTVVDIGLSAVPRLSS